MSLPLTLLNLTQRHVARRVTLHHPTPPVSLPLTLHNLTQCPCRNQPRTAPSPATTPSGTRRGTPASPTPHHNHPQPLISTANAHAHAPHHTRQRPSSRVSRTYSQHPRAASHPRTPVLACAASLRPTPMHHVTPTDAMLVCAASLRPTPAPRHPHRPPLLHVWCPYGQCPCPHAASHPLTPVLMCAVYLRPTPTRRVPTANAHAPCHSRRHPSPSASRRRTQSHLYHPMPILAHHATLTNTYLLAQLVCKRPLAHRTTPSDTHPCAMSLCCIELGTMFVDFACN